MSLPGVMPTMIRPPKMSARVLEPGIPKASVGISEPPSLALVDASTPITPRTSPVPKVSRAPLQVCLAWPYANQSATEEPRPGMMPTQQPMKLQRTTSHQFLRASMMPCRRPFLRSPSGTSEIPVPLLAM